MTTAATASLRLPVSVNVRTHLISAFIVDMDVKFDHRHYSESLNLTCHGESDAILFLYSIIRKIERLILAVKAGIKNCLHPVSRENFNAG